MKIARLITLVFIFSILIFTDLPFAKAAEVKIGYINLGKAFDEYEKTKEFDKALEKKGDTKEKERQKLVDEIKKLKDEMALLSNKGKEEKQGTVDEKILKLQEFDKDAREELKEERDQMVRDILREMDGIIQEYGKKNGYTVILNDRVLVYGNETIDITQEIVDILNKGTKKE